MWSGEKLLYHKLLLLTCPYRKYRINVSFLWKKSSNVNKRKIIGKTKVFDSMVGRKVHHLKSFICSVTWGIIQYVLISKPFK